MHHLLQPRRIRRRAPRLAVLVLLVGAGAAGGQDSHPDSPASNTKTNDVRWSLWVGNELSSFSGAEAGQPEASNLALAQSSFGFRRGDRWRAATRLAGLVDTRGRTRVRLRVREAYVTVSAGDWDLVAGKRLVRWGTGLAFSVAGVLDPPRRPDDVADRLDLNEGRELAGVSWVHGRHALTLAWASAGILERREEGELDQTLAFRDNVLIAGLDLSLILAHERGGVNVVASSFSSVVGSRVELHGEVAHRGGLVRIPVPGLGDSLALDDTSRWGFVVGAKGMPGWGIDVVAEVRSLDGLLPMGGAVVTPIEGGQVRLGTERRQTLFAGINKARLRELPGWKQWDLGASVVASLSDRSSIWVLDVERRLGLRWALHGRLMLPRGESRDTEYGIIPYTSQLSIGLRCQL